MTEKELGRQLGQEIRKMRENLETLSEQAAAFEVRLGAGEKPVEGAEWSSLITYLRDEIVTSGGIKYVALKYSKNKRPEDYPELWDIVPETPVYPVWSETPDGTIIYEGDKYVHSEAVWECTTQHTKSTVYTPKDGSSRWEKVS